MRPKSDAANPFGRRVMPKPLDHDDYFRVRFAVEREFGSRWVRTASAISLEAAGRHAMAIGGHVRARKIRGDKGIAAEWIEGMRKQD
jgi:hypothetical protein